MGQTGSTSTNVKHNNDDDTNNDERNKKLSTIAEPPMISSSKRFKSLNVAHRHFKKLLRHLLFCHRSRRTSKNHVRRNKAKLTNIFTRTSNSMMDPVSPNDMQLHWFRSKHSLLSHALSKLAFYTRLSNDKLKEKEQKKNTLEANGRNDDNVVSEAFRKISTTDLANNIELKKKFLEKIMSHPHISSRKWGNRKKQESPQEIYKRNLQKFERMVAIFASSSSSSSSHENLTLMPKGDNTIISPRLEKNVKTVSFQDDKRCEITNTHENVTVYALPQLDENNNMLSDLDENNNPIKLNKDSKLRCDSANSSLITNVKLQPRRIITSSRNRVEVDTDFMEWVKNRMGSSNKIREEVIVGKVTTTTTSSTYSSSSKSTPAKYKNHATQKKGGVKGRSASRGKGSSGTSSSKTTTTTTRTTTTTTTTSKSKKRSKSRRCEKCGPCAGKGALAGAPPAYLDYGEGGAANAPGEAWKGRRKGDPVLDRLKNVDVVEEMTYLVPNPQCGGDGDACNECDDEDCEDECDYYAVCESCGEMEPVPEELQRKLKERKKRKSKVESTPVTYSRRQRFNFKNKGDMCDDEDGPPWPYEGLQCPGPGCRCSCCVAGLRRDPECGCKCCQVMGPARKCSSFDEFPVGKNPQIRRILCPEEECAKRREFCKTLMPDNSGMYKFDLETKMFERQVPRTPTPIVVEVEAPEPLNRQQLMAVGRELREIKRLENEADTYCIQEEQNPVYLPPIYGQCNPPQCPPPPPCQPCCVPNYCCGQGPDNQKHDSKPSSGYAASSSYSHSHPTIYSGGTKQTGLTKQTTETKQATITSISTDKNNNITNDTSRAVEKKASSSSESLPMVLDD